MDLAQNKGLRGAVDDVIDVIITDSPAQVCVINWSVLTVPFPLNQLKRRESDFHPRYSNSMK